MHVEHLNTPTLLNPGTDLPRYALASLPARVGQPMGASAWFAVTQARVDAFAHTTVDLQWIHLDAERAKAGPFGSTIAHGFLTLSLLPWMLHHAYRIDGVGMSVNYGLNRVRFPSPVPVGSRVRGVFVLQACEPIAGGFQLTSQATIEREGHDKPACVAESVARLYAG
jgi:acyl dehydratase